MVGIGSPLSPATLNTPARLCVILPVMLHVFMCTSAAAQKAYFQNIDTGDGLSQRIVYDGVQDRRGFMWLATRDGLNRYDGHRFVVYRHVFGDSTSISDSKVTSVLEGSDGTLWIGTMGGGLNRMDADTETFRSWRHVPGDSTSLSANHVMDLVEGAEGAIWIRTSDRVLHLLDPDSEHLERLDLRTPDGAPAYAGGALHFDPASDRMFGPCDTASGFWASEISASGFCRLIYQHASPLVLVENILVSRTRDLRGLIAIDRDNGAVEWELSQVEGAQTGLHADSRLYFPSFHGLFQIELADLSLQHLSRVPRDPESLRDDRVTRVWLDRKGALWVGTHGGVSVHRESTGMFKTERNPLTPPVNALLEARDGTLWVGTEHGLMASMGGQRDYAVFLQPPSEVSPLGYHNRIWSLSEDARGLIWIGTGNGGLHTFDPSTERFTYHREFFIPGTPQFRPITDHSSIAHISREPGLGTWFSAKRHLILRKSATGTFHAFTTSPDHQARSSHNFSNTFFLDSEGRRWIGNDTGLYEFFYPEGEFVHRGTGPVDNLRMVWAIAESRKTPGLLWVGSVGGGLMSMDKASEALTQYTTLDGLPSDVVYGLLADDAGDLWMSSTNGIARFNPVTKEVTRFTREQGLHDNEFDLMASHRGPSGRMYFGGPTGFTSFHPDSIRVDTTRVDVLISGFRLLEAPRKGLITKGDTLTLDRRENSFTVEFAALDFERPTSHRYEYRLTGFDDAWRSTAGFSPEASYTRVPPGDYLFELKTSRADGQLGPVGASFSILIVPAFWQRGSFRWALGLALLLGVAYGAGERQRRLRRREKREAEEILGLSRVLAVNERRERGRIARELHDGPIQTLYSVNHLLEEAHASPEIAEARQTVSDLADELREVCNYLRPPLVQALGLTNAVKSRVETLTRIPGAPDVTTTFDGACDDTAEASADVAYAVINESLNNVLKHAKASRVWIEIRPGPNGIVASVRDDGVGFRPPASSSELVRERHYGIAGLWERCQELGGSFVVTSQPGQGCSVVAELPG